MSDELALTPQDFSTMTPEQILIALDSGWPWPLDAVQEWFEDLWNNILKWLHDVVDWVYDKVKPIIDNVWDWIQSAIDWITSNVGGLIDSVWDWIQSAITSIASTVVGIIHQVWDWLESVKTWLWEHIQSGWSAFTTTIRGWWTSFTTTIKGWWDSFTSTLKGWWDSFTSSLKGLWDTLTTTLKSWWDSVTTNIKSWWDSFTRELQLSWEAFKTDIVVPIQAVMNTWWTSFINTLLDFPSWVGKLFDAVFAWLSVDIPGHSPQGEVMTTSFWSWLWKSFRAGVAPWLALFDPDFIRETLRVMRPVGEVFMNLFTTFVSAIVESTKEMGPAPPGDALNISGRLVGIGAEVMTGLLAMTVAGELTVLGSKIGLGQVSAMLYDLTNYKVLTGAFLTVLVGISIRTPLTYYYNQQFRPNLPRERELADLVTHRVITKEKYSETMAYHGYPDEWITLLHKVAYRPLTPYLLRSLAEAGEVDDAFIQRVLEDAEYADADIPFIKDHMRRLAAGELKALMVSVALTRYREGFDDQTTLQGNLLALGVNPSLMDKYLFGAELQYLTDYQTDMLAFYKDSYHRRETNDAQFLESLASLGLPQERIDTIYEREKIKRLKIASTPMVAVKTLSAAQIGALFKLGKLKVDEALSRLSTYLPIVGDRQLFLLLYEPGAPAVPAG